MSLSTLGFKALTRPITLSAAYLQTTNQAQGGSKTTTFSAVNIGAADANRFVVIAFDFANFSGTGALTAVTIGGVTATIVAQTPNGGAVTNKAYTGFAYAKVPTGTTANIVCTMGNFNNVEVIDTYRIISPSGALTVHASQQASQNTSFNTTIAAVDGGVILFVGGTNAAAAGAYGGLTGITIDQAATDFGTSTTMVAGHIYNTTAAASPYAINDPDGHGRSNSYVSFKG